MKRTLVDLFESSVKQYANNTFLLEKIGKEFQPTTYAEVQKKVIGDNAVITCRPADLIPNELEKLESEMAEWKQQDEDVLSYALFPQVATDFFKYREAQQTGIDQTVADTENGSYPV